MDKPEKVLTEEQLKEGISAVASGIMADVSRESHEIFGDWMEKAIGRHSYLDMTNPEHVKLIISLTIDSERHKFARFMAALKVPPSEREKFNKLVFLMEDYGFIERQIKAVYITKIGSSCSTDVSRWLLQRYRDYILTGEIPEKFEESYWTPEAGTLTEWLDFIETIPGLYYGRDIELFIEKRQVLTAQFDAYVKKTTEDNQK